jgi:HK97 family phage portal protein
MGLFRPELRTGQPSAGQLVMAAQEMRLNPYYAPVTAEAALTHSAVWACTNLYSRLISTLPFHAYRDIDDVSVKITSPSSLRNPNGSQTFTSWVSQVTQSLVLRGNAFGLIVGRGANNLPTTIQVLPPDMVGAAYDWRTNTIDWRISGHQVPAEDIWHLAINVGPDSPLGQSVLTQARQAIGLGINSQTYGSQWFQSGGHPTGVLETEAELTADQATAIKSRWQSAVTERRGVAVLGQGFAYKPVQVSPQDTEFLNAYKLSVQDVARYFNVPPEMIGSESGASMTYSNVESRALDLLRYAIDPVLCVIEQGLSELLPRPQYVQAKRDALLRMTTLDRYQAHALALSSGWKTLDEVRAIEDLPPLVIPATDPLVIP